MKMDEFPDALGIFHAKFRLRFNSETRIRYEGSRESGLYMIGISTFERRVAVLEYDPRREEALFSFNDARQEVDFASVRIRETSDLDELLDWIKALLPEASD